MSERWRLQYLEVSLEAAIRRFAESFDNAQVMEAFVDPVKRTVIFKLLIDEDAANGGGGGK